MTIALDATYSAGAELTGVGVYSRELLWGLARAHRDERFLLCYRPHRLLRSFESSLPHGAGRRVLLEGWTPRSADVFHGLNQRLPKARMRRAVATFHDLFVLTGDYSTEDFKRRFAAQARDAAKRADLIVAVSAYTARQVEELLAVERSRIRVVPHGVHAPNEAPAGDRDKVILHVGAIQRRKNLVRLVEAFERIPAGWRLVLAGSAGFGAGEIFDRIARSPRRDDIVLPGYVEAQELTRLYARAAVFAFPSLDEGFGMPVLEAMAWGLPVVTSTRSALPEAAGDAAVLVDPTSVDEIAHGLKTVIDQPALALMLSERGRARAREYTWERTVERTWKVYSEATGG